MIEIWKNIPGHKNYQASSLGIIRSINYNKTGKTRNLCSSMQNSGYLIISLGRSHKKLVHKLIMLAFIGECNDLQVNHKNGIKTDNRLENLEYMTCSNNLKHSYSNLKRKAPWVGKKGKHHSRSKKVNQYDLEGNFVKEWGSAIEACLDLGLSRSFISSVCRGDKKTAGGFIWKY